MPKRDAKGTTGSTSPASERAHIVNKVAIEQKILEGPGSLDPSTLAQSTNPDARRWLAKRGVELLVPAGWRFMGLPFDGRGLSFNHSGEADGHLCELTTWRLADDTPLASFTQPYLEEGEEMVRLGRLLSHSLLKLGDCEGVLFVGWGPPDELALRNAAPEMIYVATDGTNRRTLSWRGAVVRGGEAQMLIVSMSSPIESFLLARPVFDAMLARLNVVS